MAEKKYIIDNAELMPEWNWEKNNELKFDPNLRKRKYKEILKNDQK